MIPTIIRKLAMEVKDEGGSLLLVGGTVRDLCLGNDHPSDWDCEVFGLSQEKLEKLLRKNYDVDFVGKCFGVYKLKHPKLDIDLSLPRTEKKTGQKHTDFEIKFDPNLPVEKAALRRDYTINSMAIDIMDAHMIDVLGGAQDLMDKKLKHSSPQFSEDPLRVLRGMQFCARFCLTADRGTINLCESLSQDNLPVERIWEEWKKLLLLGKAPSMGLKFLEQTGWIRFYPQLHAMVTCAQDPTWHSEGTVWEHTMIAMDCNVSLRDKPSEEELIIALGVLLHDCGKPFTTEEGEDGRLHAYGHSDAGIMPTVHFIQTVCPQKDLVDKVASLVKYHMVPKALYPNGKNATIRRLATKVPIQRLNRVALADHYATGYYADKEPVWADWLLEKARNLNVESNKPSPIVMGRHMLGLGMQQGPEIGQVLNAVFEAQLDGKFSDLDSGVAYAKVTAEAMGYL